MKLVCLIRAIGIHLHSLVRFPLNVLNVFSEPKNAISGTEFAFSKGSNVMRYTSFEACYITPESPIEISDSNLPTASVR